MKTTIEVKDRGEATAIQTALSDATTRAMVVIIGTLLPLSAEARDRVMRFVGEELDQHELPAPKPAIAEVRP